MTLAQIYEDAIPAVTDTAPRSLPGANQHFGLALRFPLQNVRMVGGHEPRAAAMAASMFNLWNVLPDRGTGGVQAKLAGDTLSQDACCTGTLAHPRGLLYLFLFH